MIADIEDRIDRAIVEMGLDFGISLESRQKVGLAAPRFHGIALNETIGVLPRDPLLGQGQHHPLRMDKSAQPVEIALHGLGIDHQIGDHVGEPPQREIEMDRSIGGNAALDGGVRDVALVPQRHVLERRRHCRAHQPCESCHIFA